MKLLKIWNIIKIIYTMILIPFFIIFIIVNEGIWLDISLLVIAICVIMWPFILIADLVIQRIYAKKLRGLVE